MSSVAPLKTRMTINMNKTTLVIITRTIAIIMTAKPLRIFLLSISTPNTQIAIENLTTTVIFAQLIPLPFNFSNATGMKLSTYIHENHCMHIFIQKNTCKHQDIYEHKWTRTLYKINIDIIHPILCMHTCIYTFRHAYAKKDL